MYKEKKTKITNNNFLEVGIAVSGGVDSMTLLDVFNKLKNENSLKLHALHFNHKWRKKSYLDGKLVKKYCKENKINFVYKEAKGKIVKDEEEARNQRYSFFREAAKRYNLKIICTAHHKDDQVETIIFRLARGTGPKGLQPIKELFNLSNEINIYRPFLDLTKKEILDYAKKNKIPYLNDETNQDVRYKRNLVRLKIIPLLKEINKEALNNILTFSNLVYSQNEILEDYFKKVLKRKIFLGLNDYIQRAFVYWLLTSYNIRGSISKIEFIIEAIKNKKTIDLDKKFILIVEKDKILVKEKYGKSSQINFGKEKIDIKPYKLKKFNKRYPLDKERIAYVDLSCFNRKQLSVRYRKAHDVFQPLGFSKIVKLKNYLINKKIPREERQNLPLLCLGKEVLWLPGYSLSDKLKVLNKPTHVLRTQS